MDFHNVCLESFGYCLPEERITSSELESRLAPLYERLRLPPGRLELIAEAGFESLFIFPAAGDAGAATGAAAWVAGMERTPLTDAYLGDAYDEARFDAQIQGAGGGGGTGGDTAGNAELDPITAGGGGGPGMGPGGPGGPVAPGMGRGRGAGRHHDRGVGPGLARRAVARGSPRRAGASH